METQQTIFKVAADSWQIFVDGASRGNPGLAGAGVIVTKNNTLIQRYGYFLGEKTNNQAEYLALLIGLFLITEKFHATNNITVFSDSELLVRQMNGLYKIKNELLLPFYKRAKRTMLQTSYAVKHIPRSENSYADEMANKGVDSKKLPPEQFFAWLKS